MLTRYSDSMAKKRDLFEPLDPFGGLFDGLTGLFGDVMRNTYAQPTYWSCSYTSSAGCRHEETDKELIASFDVPGVKPGDASVSVDGQTLSVAYKLRGQDHKLSYTVSSDYDASACVAKLADGVLELRFPRVQKPKGKKIAIEVK